MGMYQKATFQAQLGENRLLANVIKAINDLPGERTSTEL